MGIRDADGVEKVTITRWVVVTTMQYRIDGRGMLINMIRIIFFIITFVMAMNLIIILITAIVSIAIRKVVVTVIVFIAICLRSDNVQQDLRRRQSLTKNIRAKIRKLRETKKRVTC